jgi:hypothetical protein
VNRGWQILLLAIVSVCALGAFAWPFFASADSNELAAPLLTMTMLPALVVMASLALDRSIANGTTAALLGVLAAVATVLRVLSTGFGGFELVFTVVILSAAVFGARFGFLLGLTTMVVSSLIWGGIGPWTAFQAFALAWVGAGAGLVDRARPAVRVRPTVRARPIRTAPRIALLAAYGVVASYAFGALMNLWFWPIAVGGNTDISFIAGAPAVENLQRFIGYSLVTSTLTWDTVRAATTVAGILLSGGIVLRALARATTPRSTLPPGGGRQTRRSTVLDEVEVRPTTQHPRVRA